MVVCGHPGNLRFITTEGVIAGATTGDECGAEGCFVLDAQVWAGSSGSPVVDSRGRVVGMVWGVARGTSFSYAIATPRINEELTRVSARNRARDGRGLSEEERESLRRLMRETNAYGRQ